MTTPKKKRFAKRLSDSDCSVCGTRYTIQSGIKRCPKCGSVPARQFNPVQWKREPQLQEERVALDYSGRRKELADPSRRGHSQPLKFEDDA